MDNRKEMIKLATYYAACALAGLALVGLACLAGK
jgi:hypothetical protein